MEMMGLSHWTRINREKRKYTEKSVKGITIRCPTKHAKITWTKVPRELLENYVDMTLAIDIMAINKYHLWSAHHATYIWYCWAHTQQDKTNTHDIYTTNFHEIPSKGFSNTKYIGWWRFWMHQKWSVRNGHYSNCCIQKWTYARGWEVHKNNQGKGKGYSKFPTISDISTNTYSINGVQCHILAE